MLSHLKKFENITSICLNQVTTSQGIVSSVKPGWITLQIDVENYPGIENIFNNESATGICSFEVSALCFVFLYLHFSGRYLRKYEMNNGDCQILEDDNRVSIMTF